MKIRPARAEFHADGQTDSEIGMTKLISASRNFANASKNEATPCPLSIIKLFGLFCTFDEAL